MDKKDQLNPTKIRAFDSSQVPKPPDLEKFSWQNTQAYKALEIGCGKGMHAIQWAKAHPKSSLIAIEQTRNKFFAFEKKLRVQGHLDNLYAIRADAIWWCTHNLEGVFLDEIFVLYPNPYPKVSQKNKRFHYMPFMGFLLSHLKPGGKLTLASNVESYIQEARDVYVSIWDLELIEDSIWTLLRSPRTAFEKKYLERNERCFNLVFSK